MDQGVSAPLCLTKGVTGWETRPSTSHKSSLYTAWKCVNKDCQQLLTTELETYGATLWNEAAEDSGGEEETRWRPGEEATLPVAGNSKPLDTGKFCDIHFAGSQQYNFLVLWWQCQRLESEPFLFCLLSTAICQIVCPQQCYRGTLRSLF